jgi:Protein of unknown function (DUF2909)
MDAMQYVVIIAFIAIIGSLGAAVYFMIKGGSNADGEQKAPSSKMARALAVRIGVSVVLFICILLAWKLGYIHPTGIPAGK